MTDPATHKPRDPWLVPLLPIGATTPTESAQLEPPRNPWLVGLRCRLQRGKIDRQLARGADPSSSQCRRRRATELTAQKERAKLATAFDRVRTHAEVAPRLSVAPVNWRGVRACAPSLARLAQRLREATEVRPQGVARAEVLLTDGTSALYAPGDESRLSAELRSTLAAL